MNAAGGVVQANNYYPSGVTMAELPRCTDQGVQRYKFGGKELDRSYGLDAYDFEARPYNPLLMRFTGVDPLASKYPAISPFAYCANNPVLNIDPTGEDYWSTNDPEQIRAFINAIGSGYSQFDFSSGWNHMTDAEFLNRLTYNDETGKFWVTYGSMENGEFVLTARSFDANITPVSFFGEGYEGAFVYKPRSGFWGKTQDILGHLLDGTQYKIYDDGTNAWRVNSLGRITGQGPRYIIGYPPAVGKGGAFKGSKLFKGGSQMVRDASIKQYPREFQKWYHKYYKGNSKIDATKQELKEIYNEWVKMNKPNVK